MFPPNLLANMGVLPPNAMAVPTAPNVLQPQLANLIPMLSNPMLNNISLPNAANIPNTLGMPGLPNLPVNAQNNPAAMASIPSLTLGKNKLCNVR